MGFALACRSRRAVDEHECSRRQSRYRAMMRESAWELEPPVAHMKLQRSVPVLLHASRPEAAGASGVSRSASTTDRATDASQHIGATRAVATPRSCATWLPQPLGGGLARRCCEGDGAEELCIDLLAWHHEGDPR